jgi:mono/diheme cytochrome c family protein
MKRVINTLIVVSAIVFLSSCQDKRKPNYQFMPNMYDAVGYEAYGEVPKTLFENKMEARHPAVNSIARGQVPYEYANTNAAYDSAKVNLKSPIAFNEENLEKGKKLYNVFCISCHGKNGIATESVLAKREKFLGVPNYKDRDITEGSIYHVLMHGKGAMGSHASQLKPEERWQIVQYVLALKNK